MAEEKETAVLCVKPGAWAAVEGHEKTRARLARLLLERRVPHALLFSGPQGIGKKQAALATAAAFLCLEPKDGIACGECASCKALAAGTHPDFFAVLPETSGKAARSVKIEQIRDMRGMIARAPKFSTRRAVLLDDAETMNDAAANALLKTLEEPPGDTLFLLVTGARQALLPTIVSRCMIVPFAPLDDDAMARVLAAHDVSEDSREPLIALSDGSAGRALRLFAEDALTLREDAMATLEKLPQMTPETTFSIGARLGALDRERLLEWFRYLRMLLRDVLAVMEGSSSLVNGDFSARLFSFAGMLSANRAFEAEREATEAARRLSTSNASPRLVVESFLLRARF
jgi:DNA polymerase-3 subunit delta'